MANPLLKADLLTEVRELRAVIAVQPWVHFFHNTIMAYSYRRVLSYLRGDPTEGASQVGAVSGQRISHLVGGIPLWPEHHTRIRETQLDNRRILWGIWREESALRNKGFPWLPNFVGGSWQEGRTFKRKVIQNNEALWVKERLRRPWEL